MRVLESSEVGMNVNEVLLCADTVPARARRPVTGYDDE